MEIDANAAQVWIYPNNYPIRKYQQDIVKTALFQNTLISLPTGMGKTLIAAVVMYNFYRWYPTGKIIFLAPTKPLVAQQMSACSDIVGIPEEDTALFDGTCSVPSRIKLWQEKRVFFCTPQTVDNDIQNDRCPVSSIVCLVIDEAHRATGNYAYVKLVSALSRLSTNFRIVALSATPGTDKRSIQNVLYNLQISSIEWRGEDDADLAPYRQQKNIEIVKCKQSSSGLSSWADSTYKRINDCIRHIGVQLVSWGLLLSEEPDNISDFIIKEAECSAQSLLVNSSSLPSPSPSSSPSASTIISTFELIKLFLKCRALIRNERYTGPRKNYQATPASLQTNLQEAFEPLLNRAERMSPQNQIESTLFGIPSFLSLSRSMRNAQESFTLPSTTSTISSTTESKHSPDSLISNPKIAKLREILLAHFNLHQSSSEATERDVAGETSTRVIVFVSYRATAADIVRELSNTTDLRLAQFIGQKNSTTQQPHHQPSSTTSKENNSHNNSHNIMKGQTQKEQKEILNSFNCGVIQVLIATCIAEEGLDIAEVDLIISYDMVASPIRMIQRNGRTGRKRDGKVIILITEGKEEEKLCQSMDRMDAMQDSIERQKLMSQLHFYQKPNQMIANPLDCVMVERNLHLPNTGRPTDSSHVAKTSVKTKPIPVTKSTARKEIPFRVVGLPDVIDLDFENENENEGEKEENDLFSWTTYPSISTTALPLPLPSTTQEIKLSTIFSNSNQHKVLDPAFGLSAPAPGPVVVVHDLVAPSSHPIVDMTAEGSKEQKGKTSWQCSICGLEIFSSQDEDANNSTLCAVCVDMMSIPVSQDDSDTIPPPPNSLPSTLPLQNTSPQDIISITNTLPVSSKPPLHHHNQNHNQHNHNLTRNKEANQQSSLFDLGIIFQQPTNSSGRYLPSLETDSSSPLIQISPIHTTPSSIEEPYEISDKEERIVKPRFPFDIPPFPSLTSQDSAGSPKNPSSFSPLTPLRRSPPRGPTTTPTITNEMGKKEENSDPQIQSNLHILLPNGKTFALATAIFSDEEDDDCSHPSKSHSHPPLPLPPRHPVHSAPNPSSVSVSVPVSVSVSVASIKVPDGRLREKSERRSKKMEDVRALKLDQPCEVKKKQDEESAVTWDWNWPALATQFDHLTASSSSSSSSSSEARESPLKKQPASISLTSTKNVTFSAEDISRDEEEYEDEDEDNYNDDQEEDVDHLEVSVCPSESNMEPQICQICSSKGKVWTGKLPHNEDQDEDEDDEEDVTIRCIKCQLFVHLSCYGLQSPFNHSETFVCESCRYGGSGLMKPKCKLCLQATGMMRRVNLSSPAVWVHPLCVLFTPELTLNVENQMRPNDISVLDADRESLCCDLCQKQGGSNIQCSYDDCFVSFHPYCGFLSQKQMIIRRIATSEIGDDNENEDNNDNEDSEEENEENDDCVFYYEVYCDKHRRRVQNLDNIVSSTAPLPTPREKRHNHNYHDYREEEQEKKPFEDIPLDLISPEKTLHEESWLQDSGEKQGKKRRRLHRLSSPPSRKPGTGKKKNEDNQEKKREKVREIEKEKKKDKKKRSRTENSHLRYRDLVVIEAELSGSDSGDERSSECDGDYDYNDTFINDGEYTQAPDSVDTGMAMYHNIHRQYLETPPHLRFDWS